MLGFQLFIFVVGISDTHLKVVEEGKRILNFSSVSIKSVFVNIKGIVMITALFSVDCFISFIFEKFSDKSLLIIELTTTNLLVFGGSLTRFGT